MPRKALRCGVRVEPRKVRVCPPLPLPPGPAAYQLPAGREAGGPKGRMLCPSPPPLGCSAPPPPNWDALPHRFYT